MKYKKYWVFLLIIILMNIGIVNAINKNAILLELESNNLILTNTNVGGNECNKEAIFGSKSDPNSISYLVNEILQYPRYIVPALVIVFTSIDLFKAVIAGKEDEMKKAQSTAIKRVIVAVIVFLVPMIVNIIMYLADIAWQGTGMCH